MSQRRSIATVYLGGALAAACAAVALSAFPVSVSWRVLLMGAALYLGYLAFIARVAEERRKAQQMSELHLATTEALALAIDARGHTRPNRIRRVQAYATGLARALELAPVDVQTIRTAALLHDIGKLAIPDHILAKRSPLTPEECQKVRLHPQAGAEILRSVPFPYPVITLIRCHHERWDGRGYPAGLKEDQIPLGARVISVADHFDALLSDRAYQKPLDREGAVALLQQESGKVLDPRLVDLFISILPALAVTGEPLGRPAPPQSVSAPRVREHEAGTAPGSPARLSVFEDIAVAQREICELYQIAQALGTALTVADTMELVSSRLSNLIPFSACALFLYSNDSDQLHCRFAAGTDSELIRQLTLRNGHGLTGWVARNRRPLVNARPRADFQAMGLTAPTVLQSALVCPLIHGDKLIGTLAVYHREPSAYQEDHARLLDRVCEQAAAVIHNATVFEKTQEDSLTDPLTNLPNTRSLVQYVTRELARAARLETEVAVILLDVNDFKDINDTYGHAAGDSALREVAGVLRGTIRPYDLCVRYAGDEFVVVLSGCGAEEAESKRLELQSAVSRVALDAESGGQTTLSISAGAAVFPADGDTCEALLAKADRRMYGVKQTRKRAAVHAPAADTPLAS